MKSPVYLIPLEKMASFKEEVRPSQISHINGDRAIVVFGQVDGINQTPGLCNITLFDVPGQSLIVNLDLAGFAISYGAACASGSTKPSAIHSKIDIPENEAECTVRISISRLNTSKEVSKLTKALGKIIPKIKREPINV